jgi:predicted nucleic acid-binding protein
MILLDTVVLSELRKPQPSCSRHWLSSQRDTVSRAVSLGETERGIENALKPSYLAGAGALGDDLVNLYGDRILPVTPVIARRWGSLSARIGNDSADLLIAATAITHGLQVATRNIRHFAPTEVEVVNPFEHG